MTHLEIVQAIEARGGKLVASFVLDDEGRTVGAPITHNRRAHCGACGEAGHTIKRCRGAGVEPRPSHDETRRILRERADARTAARRRGTPRK